MGLKKTGLLIVVLIIGLIIIRNTLSYLSLPYINFSLLLLISIYLWSAISDRIKKQKSILKITLTGLFYLPLFVVAIASIAMVFTKMDEWPDFFRVYFVGGIFTYIVSLIFPVFFLFISDIIRWIQLLFVTKKKNTTRVDKLKGEPISRKKFLVNTGFALGGIALGTMGFGMLHGNYNFKIWQHRLSLKRIPNSMRGLKIVQISDLHLGTWVSKSPLEEAVAYINELKADLVFFTGDLVNSKTDEAFPFAETLQKIESKYGVYASLGNHDYGHYHQWENKEEEEKNWSDLIEFYEFLGWKLLRNQSETIEINGSFVNIVGVENWSINPRFPQIGDLAKATESNPIADLNLLLSHDPTHWDYKAKDFPLPMDITFSGHTHGFQFGIESKLFRWSPAQYMYKHWAGLYKHETEEKYLNVNRGIGAIGFPGRVGIRPEITLVEIT